MWGGVFELHNTRWVHVDIYVILHTGTWTLTECAFTSQMPTSLFEVSWNNEPFFEYRTGASRVCPRYKG